MKRFFGISTEHHSDAPVLSLEEEMIETSEAAADEAAVETDLKEIDRAEEVAQALEELADVADTITEATPAEANLMEIAGDIAVAGTDIPGDEVVPAMEGYIGRRIATETIRERASAIWNKILSILKGVWERIESFFYRIFGTIPGRRKRLEALEKRIDEAVSKKKEEAKIKLTSGLQALTVDNAQLKDESSLRKAVETLVAQTENVYEGWMGAVAKAGSKAADALNDFDAEKPDVSAEKLLAAVKPESDSSFKASGWTNTDRLPGFKCSLSPALMGGNSLMLKRFVEADGKTLIGRLDRNRRGGLEFVKTHEKPKALPNEIEFATLSTSAMQALVGDLGKLLDTLEGYKRGKRAGEIKKTQKELEKGAEKAAAALDKAKNDADADKGAIPIFRAMAGYNQAYAGWVASPAISLMSSTLTNINAVMYVIEKSLAAYK